ncbi:MAG: PTS lactose transporter subunit IIC [Rhodobacterales bacterium]|nr:MAG: PTS lactose transporter subunit IIC [Rhodobacterales bacterium]
MDLSSILRPAAVKVLASTTSRKRLFQSLGDIVSSCYGLDAGAAFTALQRRESLGPTAVGQGVALPHARIEGLDNVVGAFIRVEKPIDFDAVDRQPVDLVFALFAPDGSGVDHLKALALVSRTMRDNATIAKLRANNDPDTLYTILVEAQGARAG